MSMTLNSMTLNFVDHLLERGRNLQDLGYRHEARRALSRLAQADLPAEQMSNEVHGRLARIAFDQGDFEGCRRHLSKALAFEPASAEHHYWMGRALEADDNGDAEEALKHYRLSLERNSENTDCLADFAGLAYEMGYDEEAIDALERAVRLAPNHCQILTQFLETLAGLGRGDEALDHLRVALFQHPRDPRFRKVWSDFHFQRLRSQQEAAQSRYFIPRQQPRVLPFTGVVAETAEAAPPRAAIRQHGPSRPRGPHVPGPRPISGKKPA